MLGRKLSSGGRPPDGGDRIQPSCVVAFEAGAYDAAVSDRMVQYPMVCVIGQWAPSGEDSQRRVGQARFGPRMRSAGLWRRPMRRDFRLPIVRDLPSPLSVLRANSAANSREAMALQHPLKKTWPAGVRSARRSVRVMRRTPTSCLGCWTAQLREGWVRVSLSASRWHGNSSSTAKGDLKRRVSTDWSLRKLHQRM